PETPWARRVLWHAAVRPACTAHRECHPRPRDPGNCAPRGNGFRQHPAIGRGTAPRRGLYPRSLAAEVRIGAGWLIRPLRLEAICRNERPATGALADAVRQDWRSRDHWLEWVYLFVSVERTDARRLRLFHDRRKEHRRQ